MKGTETGTRSGTEGERVREGVDGANFLYGRGRAALRGASADDARVVQHSNGWRAFVGPLLGPAAAGQAPARVRFARFAS
jgi:hypothetical protein